MNRMSVPRLTMIAVLPVVSAVACSRVEPPATAQTAPAQPVPDGEVQISDASRKFIVVKEPSDDATTTTLKVPAHVEFKDGAVVQLGAPFDGRVVKVHVQTGERVEKGAPLATLECPDAASARAAMDTANASLREARVTLQRQVRMQDEGVGIERERLEAQTKVEALEAELKKSEATVTFAGTGAGATVVMRAPMSGTVLTRKMNDGMAVQRGGDAILELGDPSKVWIVADVFERDLGQVRKGANVTVELPSVQKPLTGRVASVGTVVATGLRTAPVRIDLASATDPLHPGMYGRAAIAAGASIGDLTLPAEAVLIKDKDTVVYIEKTPTTFQRRSVVVGPATNGYVRVISGLSPHDRVVTRGALLLDGSADQLL